MRRIKEADEDANTEPSAPPTPPGDHYSLYFLGERRAGLKEQQRSGGAEVTRERRCNEVVRHCTVMRSHGACVGSGVAGAGQGAREGSRRGKEHEGLSP